MAKKTGVPSLIQVAKRLCYLITKFSPIIAATYPDNAALQAALAAAMTACSALELELQDVYVIGS